MADTNGQQAAGQKIGRQIVLPFSKAFEIAWKGIRIRIWRSLITMSGIILAIAFLMSVWTAGVFQRAFSQVPEDHDLYTIVRGALEAEAIATGAVRIRCAVLDDAVGVEASVTTPGRAIRSFLSSEKVFQAYRVPADDLLAALQAEGEQEVDALVVIGLPQAVTDPAGYRAVKDFVEAGGFLLIYGSEGIEAAGPAAELLPASPTGEVAEAEGSGISLTPRTVQVDWQRHPQTTFALATAKPDAVSLAKSGDLTTAWSRKVGAGEVVWYPVAGESGRGPDALLWFVRGQAIGGGQGGSVAESLMVRSIAHGAREGGTIRDMRGIWLVTLSLMVCVVGITNAMLMSVTERYREIGTMKCLGALDKFVVKLFLIESSLQGVVGSLAGALIGFLLAFIRAMFTFHVKDLQTDEGYWLAFRFFPALSLLGWVSIALVTGIILSVVAAIYPAVRAARMQPVEAMRSEA